MRTMAMAMVLALAAGGCAIGVPPGAPVPIEAETISYATGPCFGACPVFTVTVGPDGRGTFEGKRHTAVTGTRAFAIDPAAYRRFAAILAPHRPEGEALYQPGTKLCPNAPTDMPSVDIAWSDVTGGGAHLAFYGGCAGANPALAMALREARAVLPIDALVGGR